MKTIALMPPKPALNLPKPKKTIPMCSSCDKPLNGTGECQGCTK